MLPYSVREGVANLRRAKFSAVASTSAIAVALVLVGVFGIVGYEASVVSDMLREQAGQMEVFIEQDASEQVQEALHARIQTIQGIAQTEFVSHEEAAKIFRREFGEGASAFEDPTFLPASIKIEMKPTHTHPDSMARTANVIGEWRGVDDVVLNQELLVRVAQNRRLINAVGIALGGIVVLAAVFLVANTIRLTIYARRLLIRTMKLVGATDRFVRRPFLVEGIVQGFLGGTIAGGVVWGLYRVFFQQIDQAPLPLRAELFLLGGLIGGGVLLGWIGSYFAARRFIQNIKLH
ncbi:MAG: ABC transporter permease [Bacteroidetes bacterium QH_10_64_37]|nr:MAG: ABC transporter permease [Bacteroidetes bacterium QH_10_64_37]